MDMTRLTAQLKTQVAKLEQRVPYASALATRQCGTTVRVTPRAAAVEPKDPMLGCVLSAFTGLAFVEVSTNDLSATGLDAAAALLLEHAEAAGIDLNGPGVDPGGEAQASHVQKQEQPAENVPLAQKVDRARDLHARLTKRDTRLVHSVVRLTDTQTEEIFVNRTRTLHQQLARAEAVVFVVMAANGAQTELYGGRGKAGGFEHCDLPDHLLDEVVTDCGRILGAPRLEGGTHECIFSPDFSGLFAHEAFGHGTEADMFLKRRARGEQFLGKPVASPLVNMFDSPALPGEAASFFFDHEGQPATATQIIKDGTLQHAITNLDAALRMGLPRTANGRRESFERKAYTRMTNTYFAPGTSTVDQLMGSVDKGYLIKHGSNGMEDPKGWGIQCEGYMAEEISGGKLTGRVFSPVIVTGYVPDLLMSITGVSNAMQITGLGMCGKGHKEWVKVTDGGPYLRLTARVA